MPLSPTSLELLEDRIKFKFHAAKEHLHNLKYLEARGETANNADGRIKWEIEIEDLLLHLIGARDALLVRVSEKLDLELKIWNVTPKNVCDKLGSTKRKDLIKDLCNLLDETIYPSGSWLSKLNDMRNTGTHRKILNLSSEVNLFENVNTGKGSSGATRIYFKDDPDTDLEIIPYLEDRIQKMEALIQTIINKEPLLSSPYFQK